MKRKKALDLLADSDSEGEDIADILGGQRRHQKSTYEQRQEKVSTIKVLKIQRPNKNAVVILKLEQNRFITDELAQKM